MKRSIFVRGLSAAAALLMVFSMTACSDTATTSEVWEEEVLYDEEGNVISTEQTGENDTASGDAAENNSGGATGTNSKTGTGNNNGGGNTGGTTNNGGGNTGGTTNTGTTNINLKGAPIIIASWGTSEPQKTSKTYKQELELNQSIEKKYNCKFKYVHTNGDSLVQDGRVATATAAGTKYADILLMTSDNNFPRAALKGFLHPLDNYVNLSSSQWEQSLIKMSEIKGAHYWVQRAGLANHNGAITVFNKQVFKNLGVSKTPYDYVDAGNWNWDTFEELAKSLTKTQGGKQYYGLSWTGLGYATAFMHSNGRSLTRMENGKEVFDYTGQTAYDGIAFAEKLYHQDHVCGGNWEDGTAAMWFSSMWGMVNIMDKLGAANVGATYIVKGPAVKDYYYDGSGGVSMWGIPSTVKNPAEVAQIMTDYLSPQKWRATASEALSKYAPDKKALEYFIDISNRQVKNFRFVGYHNPNDIVKDYGVKDNASPQATIASLQPKMQAQINKAWEGYDTFKPKF